MEVVTDGRPLRGGRHSRAGRRRYLPVGGAGRPATAPLVLGRRREREATAERTSAALQVLKQQGRATGGVAPYGCEFIDGRREWHQGEQPSSSTAPPASHGRRGPTSSAPPGTAPAPAASGRARAPTRSTGRANVTTKRQRRAPRAAGVRSRGIGALAPGRLLAVARSGRRRLGRIAGSGRLGRRPPCRRTTHATSSPHAAPSPRSTFQSVEQVGE